MSGLILKNNDKSKELRIKGNKIYQSSQLYEALAIYNESLCYAIDGSEDMAFAYANRSAVYFELKYYDKAISNIQKALVNNYPDEKKKALLDRKEKAAKLMNEMPQKEEKGSADDFFKLTYNPNPKYPSFADCIELRSNAKYGRYLVTNRNLKVGDIIAIENFLYYSINDKYEECLYNFQLCAFCLKSNLLDLQPCKQCVHTMYCSEKCLLADQNQAHNLECSLMEFYIQKPSYHSVFSSFFMALSVCNGSIDELKELIEEVESYGKRITVFDFDFSKMSESEKKKKLIQIMYCGQRKNCGFDQNVLQEIMFLNPKTKIMYESNKEFIIKFITRLHQVHVLNFIDFSKLITPEMANKETWPAGDCMLPGFALINHSCAPNAQRIEIGKKFALVVIRRIKKGEQIFLCSGSDYMVEDMFYRKELLKPYDFKCECIACKRKFPTFENCPKVGLMLDQANHELEAIEKLISDKEMTPTLAKKFIKQHCNILNEFYPSNSYGKDYHLLTKCVTTCLNVIAAYLQESSLEKIP